MKRNKVNYIIYFLAFDFQTLSNLKLKVSFKDQEIKDTNQIQNFEEITDLDVQIYRNLKRMKFSKMTPIQKAVIPHMSKGYDVIGCSQTGSGKTIAFLLPIINKMLKEGPPPEYKEATGEACPVAVVVVPTRELAEQIFKEARKLVHRTGINVVKVFGGVGYDNQKNELKYGCDLLIATPGRLKDFIDHWHIFLAQVKYLILDEADRMLDMGFEPQLRAIVDEYDLCKKEERQNLMFSATFEPEIKILAKSFMKDYYFIQTENFGKVNDNITQEILNIEEDYKTERLKEMIKTRKGSILIFVGTKRGCDSLCNNLFRSGYNAIAIHGDKKQKERQDAIDKFSSGEVDILLATDVVARGLDFPKVSYVFNYDMPQKIDDYIHRIGRTGRCGEKGTAISFVSEKNRGIVSNLYNLLKSQNQIIPEWFEKFYSDSRYYYKGFSKRNNSFFTTADDYKDDYGNQEDEYKFLGKKRDGDKFPTEKSELDNNRNTNGNNLETNARNFTNKEQLWGTNIKKNDYDDNEDNKNFRTQQYENNTKDRRSYYNNSDKRENFNQNRNPGRNEDNNRWNNRNDRGGRNYGGRKERDSNIPNKNRDDYGSNNSNKGEDNRSYNCRGGRDFFNNGRK